MGMGMGRDASERNRPLMRSPKRVSRRLEEVAKAVGGGREGLLSVTNVVEAGTCGQGDSNWAIGWYP